ncbi:hypothetical protein O8B93_22150 [Agrobacterium rhizogenes]|uniref:hypothetical protein n=1 Tax=Rhizobium rhizogenes TaxID=359 RepID=UPI0022B6149F|nr:hypothetical protein [Rhizobium rhizogenes]MCZ7450290.1 hypothetical protein [Rhizobium rhizogenes]
MGRVDGAKPVELKITSDEEWHQYYAALGRLMFAFATMEEEVNRLLEDYVRDDLLGLKKAPPRSAKIIKALISGMRISAAKDTIKRLLRVADAPAAVEASVTEILSHLTDLTTLRDQLAHHASFPTMLPDGTFQTTNQSSAREIMKIEWVTFHPRFLLAAAEDLEQIPLRLRLALRPLEKARLSADPSWEAEIVKHSQPWRYKPGELIRTGPKHDKNPQWRSLPPRSSQE